MLSNRPAAILDATIRCPACGFEKLETMPMDACPRVAATGVHVSPTGVDSAPVSLHVAPDDRCFGPASPCVQRGNRGFAANTVHPGDIEAGAARINRGSSPSVFPHMSTASVSRLSVGMLRATLRVDLARECPHRESLEIHRRSATSL